MHGSAAQIQLSVYTVHIYIIPEHILQRIKKLMKLSVGMLAFLHDIGKLRPFSPEEHTVPLLFGEPVGYLL